MQLGKTNAVVGFLRDLSEADNFRKLPDRELLDRFTSQQSHGAFAAIVHRHGPMVLRLCQRVLGNKSDAEDAFQATFLVLMRNAPSVTSSGSLGGWLHSVAYRTAQRARVARARRHKYESHACQKQDVDPLAKITVAEAHEILDRELSRLPDKFRVPLVLCYLEGLTGDEAARQLGWPGSTLKSRLEQARERLRRRLMARGVGLSSVLVASLFSEVTAQGSVPSMLVHSTVSAASNLAAGQAVTTVVSAKVAALTQGVVTAMLIKKLAIAALLPATAMIVLGVALWAQGISASGPLAATEAAAKADGVQNGAVNDDGRKAVPPPADRVKLQGAWKVASTLQNGQEVDHDPKAPAARMYFQDDQVYEMSGEYFMDAHTFKLDPKEKPATIDLMNYRGHTIEAIYRLEGEALTLCKPIAPSMARPAKFASEAESNTILMTLKRDPQAPKLDLEKVKAAQKATLERQPVAESLMKIVLAMYEHREDKGSLPARAIFDGKEKPLLSWRVALLPYLGEKALYDRFRLDEPWDSEHNKKLLAEMPAIYGAGAETSYQVFAGDGTAFDGVKAAKFDDFRDGVENTILLAVAARSVPWTKPEDLPYAADKPLPKLGGMFKEGFHVAAGDGSVRFVPNKFNEKALRALITIAGDEKEGFAELQSADAQKKQEEATPEGRIKQYEEAFRLQTQLGAGAATKSLKLTGEKLTDEVMKLVGKLTSLESLDLSDSLVTDAGLRHVKTLTKLRELRLANCPITDAGLQHLYGLKELGAVTLPGSLGGKRSAGVTDVGTKELQARLPKLKITVVPTSETAPYLRRQKSPSQAPSPESTDGTIGVPILSKIPYLGRLFRN